MLVVHVHVHVKPEAIDLFKAATMVNGRLSRTRTRGGAV